MSERSIPDGYTSFEKVLTALYLNSADWQLSDIMLQSSLAAYMCDPDDIVAYFGGLHRWERDRSAAKLVQALLGSRLASGSATATGINCRSGELAYLPASAWRLQVRIGGNHTSMIEAASKGTNIVVPSTSANSGGIFYPLLSRRELAVSFGAQNLPSEPELRPAQDRREMETDQLRPSVNMASSSQPDAQTSPSEKVSVKAGVASRPLKHDWDAFWIEVARKANLDGLEPEHRPSLRRHLIEWWQLNSGSPPEPTTIDKKLTMLYRAVIPPK